MPAAWSHGFGGQGKALPSRIHCGKNRESDPYTQDFARWIPNQVVFWFGVQTQVKQAQVVQQWKLGCSVRMAGKIVVF